MELWWKSGLEGVLEVMEVICIVFLEIVGVVCWIGIVEVVVWYGDGVEEVIGVICIDFFKVIGVVC